MMTSIGLIVSVSDPDLSKIRNGTVGHSEIARPLLICATVELHRCSTLLLAWLRILLRLFLFALCRPLAIPLTIKAAC